VQVLLEQIGDPELIDPHHSRTDDNLGSFLAYILLDALKHAGLVREKQGYVSEGKRRQVLEFVLKRAATDKQTLEDLLAQL
jgi:hypothetical protein